MNNSRHNGINVATGALKPNESVSTDVGEGIAFTQLEESKFAVVAMSKVVCKVE